MGAVLGLLDLGIDILDQIVLWALQDVEQRP